jgi:prophage maintenance system killer protein
MAQLVAALEGCERRGGLYSDLALKAATLGIALINNHPFIDGYERVGHAALETFHLIRVRSPQRND